jgi:hypothetical protein
MAGQRKGEMRGPIFAAAYAVGSAALVWSDLALSAVISLG